MAESSGRLQFHQIRAHVEKIRSRSHDPCWIGIRSQIPWTGEEWPDNGGEKLRILQCDAPIQFRKAFHEDSNGETSTVFITPLDLRQLGDDISIRLAGQRLYPLDPWHVVRWMFKARQVDPRVTAHGWMADRLMALEPAEGYPAVLGGVLDAETVWGILLDRILGMETGTPDLMALLKWAADAENVARWHGEDESFRAAVREWVSRTAGPTGGAILQCVSSDREPVALAAGLAMSVVYHEAAGDALARSAGRLEQRAGLGEISAPMALRWHAAAVEVIRHGFGDSPLSGIHLDRSDRLLEVIGAADFAHLGNVSPAGFQQRLAQFAQALNEGLASTPVQVPEALLAARDRVLAHEKARSESPRRLERLTMAIRLLRWLEWAEAAESDSAGSPDSRDFSSVARDYVRHGGFVDWARARLGGGDSAKPLSQAFARLVAAVTQRRERQNRDFAERLADWTRSGSQPRSVLRVEDLLEKRVAPLLSDTPLLLLVVDGMSQAVFQELLEDVTARDWVELIRTDETEPPPVVSVLPSVTRCSRASLFHGRLAEGDSAAERAAFASHPVLRSAGAGTAAPVLFHKVSMTDAEDGGLSKAVREALAATGPRVVGVVLNAVDDHLSKGEQVDPSWNAEYVRSLSALLYEARSAGRLVLLTSDHGHVLERGGETRPDGEGERWRLAGPPPGEGELAVSGDRVLGAPGGEIIALWSERFRYGMKKNGYHGGISPQEMVIPMALLKPVQREKNPHGWAERPRYVPPWWEGETVEAPPEREPMAAPIPIAQTPEPPAKGQLDIFHAHHGETEPVSATAPETAPEALTAALSWPDRIFGTPMYRSQKAIAGRALPGDAEVRTFLHIMDRRGGTVTVAALSRELGKHAFRLRGWLASLQRLLNVEGYAILSRDEANETITLNIELLKRQFEVE
jgi:hypothetical protein